jgi:hypothetical protein
VALTSPVAVLRLHGRNGRGLPESSCAASPRASAEKYGYLYDEAEVTEIVSRVDASWLDTRADVYFKLNNNVGDAPAINGIQIRELLGQETPDRTTVEAEWRRRRTRWTLLNLHARNGASEARERFGSRIVPIYEYECRGCHRRVSMLVALARRTHLAPMSAM